MSEMIEQTANKNLHVLLNRYSMLDYESDQPSVMNIANVDAQHMAAMVPRNGHLFGELTEHGLVHIWADTEKTDNCFAHVLVIGKKTVAVQSHTYNRRAKIYNQGLGAGITLEVPLVKDADPIAMMTSEQMHASGITMDIDQAKDIYGRVERTLGKFAIITRQYDALHQTIARRYPVVHQNMEQLYPYAGHAFGPRINVCEMQRAGVPFHPGVQEALEYAPDLVIDS